MICSRKVFFYLLVLAHLRKLRRLVSRDQAVNQLLEIAVHDCVDLIECQLDPVVGHTSLREVVGTDLLGTVAGTDLAAALLRLLILASLKLHIV